MIPKIFLLLLCFLKLGDGKEKAVVLKMDAEEIADTFRSVLSSQYMAKLANEFATKAAEYFLNEMKNKEEQKSNDQIAVDYRSPIKKKPKKSISSEKFLLDDNQALTLIEDPSPDGDNLELAIDLSDGEHIEEEKKPIPVIQLMKINGVYYRRLLGVLNA